MAFARSLRAEERDRIGTHTRVGPLTIEAQLTIIAGHNGYHLLQVVQWLNAAQ
jgi:hypothetical protein